MFKPVSSNASFPELEAEIGQFWQERQIYEKSLAKREGGPKFVFYEGPPTANGMPHPGHCLTRAIKDLFPRYRTMRGFYCERKAGWDTHGLPVEVEVCKELGIHSKDEIEAYGIEPFIHKCQESVWRYMQQWERLTQRLGFWIHLDEAYVTYHQSYVESVWWALKKMFDRGLLYQGHKIVWWWAQGGTALSSGEVGDSYREVADPSLYVKFPLVDDPETSLLVWTTTPWTLPSNQFAAVHPELEYAIVADGDDGKLIIAADLVETIAAKTKKTLSVESTIKGADLYGKRYVPPFDYFHGAHADETGTLAAETEQAGSEQHLAWRIVWADFVTTDTGTGIVHQAPAFGEVDYEVLLAEQLRFKGPGPQLICAVGPDGKFTSEAPDYVGRWVKEADKDICRDLRQRGSLFHLEQYLHEYPFCWRAPDDPLIQYPREGWFIRTTQIKEDMLANNQQINWMPDHIKDGRFGNFLESNVDWALSRERYWGTPLPIWVCSETGKMEAIEQYDDLLNKEGVSGLDAWTNAKREKPDLPDDLKVHKPYIDQVTYDSPFAAGARMERVSEVIDCWFDSGAMPFAQWGYPHRGQDAFRQQFPADFISEAIDQTRGWFYSQLAISTLLFGEATSAQDEPAVPWPHPFKNCIVLGLMLAEWWESKDGQRFLTEEECREACGSNGVRKIGKMSKQLRNYRSPEEIFDVHGADALRWYFFANQAPWNSIIYSERSIKESIPEFLLKLWNCYGGFFVEYANIDGFDPGQAVTAAGPLTDDWMSQAETYREVAQRSELDRWILSELHTTIQLVTERMDAYDNFTACRQLIQFVDALSNWYVRRSRDRFWRGDKQDVQKLDGYWTLYECLLTTTKLIAPFVPFIAESIWQNLAVTALGDRVEESVHLCDFPQADERLIDADLAAQMSLMREITSLGRSARMGEKLKVRQPLSAVTVVLADQTHLGWLQSHAELIAEELNVKQVDFATEAAQFIDYQVVPNFKRLGPRVGKQIPAVKKALGEADGGQLLSELKSQGKIVLSLDGDVELDDQDIEVRLQAKPGFAAAQGAQCVVVLTTELTDALVHEGYARDLVRATQDQRKALDCHRTGRIDVYIACDDPSLTEAIATNQAYIQGETLADGLVVAPQTEILSQVSTVEHGEGVAQVDVVIDEQSLQLFVVRK